jgi:hypothetical protein
MPAYPDRDTLRLRTPDRRSPAEAARVVARELARRPAATRWDVKLAPPDRALAMFRENYPGLAERFHAGVLWSVAHGHGHGHPGAASSLYPCGWCMALVRTRAPHAPQGGPLRVDQLGLAALGPPCPMCSPIVDPRPKPKPRGKRAARTSTSTRTTRARSSTSTARARAPLTAVRERARVAAHVAGGRVPAAPSAPQARAVVAAAFPVYTPAERAAYNQAALVRMEMDPDSAPHLTGGRP